MKTKLIALLTAVTASVAMFGCNSDSSAATREAPAPNPVVKAPTSAAEATGQDKAKSVIAGVASGAANGPAPK